MSEVQLKIDSFMARQDTYDTYNERALQFGIIPKMPYVCFDNSTILVVAQREIIEAMMAQEPHISYVGRVIQVSSDALWKVGSTGLKIATSIVTSPFSFFKK